RIGFLIDGKVVDVQNSYQLLVQSREEDLIESIETFLPADPNAFFRMGTHTIERAQWAFDYIVEDQADDYLSFSMYQVNLGAPIPNPGKIICVGQNYADHVAEMDSKLPEHPVL